MPSLLWRWAINASCYLDSINASANLEHAHVQGSLNLSLGKTRLLPTRTRYVGKWPVATTFLATFNLSPVCTYFFLRQFQLAIRLYLRTLRQGLANSDSHFNVYRQQRLWGSQFFTQPLDPCGVSLCMCICDIMHTRVRVCVCVCTCACVCVHVCVCVRAYVCMCLLVCVGVRVCTCKHIHAMLFGHLQIYHSVPNNLGPGRGY